MSKRQFVSISSGLEGWDADMDDNFDVSGRTFPIPLFENTADTSFSGLPTANQNDRGLAAFLDTTAGWLPALSDGTSWKKIGSQSADPGALTDNVGGTQSDTLDAIPDPADAPASADALRDDLVANTLPQIRDAVSSLADAFNDLRTNMRNSGLMA